MLDNLRAKLSLVNWQYQMYRILLVVVIAGGWSYFMWDKGKDYGYKACNEETVAEIVTVVNSRLPVIQQAERGAARLEQELSTIKEKLDEEATTRTVPDDCSISDSQLWYYREAASKTRR